MLEIQGAGTACYLRGTPVYLNQGLVATKSTWQRGWQTGSDSSRASQEHRAPLPVLMDGKTAFVAGACEGNLLGTGLLG